MKYVGIDLGSYSIKSFEVESSNKDIHLLNYNEQVLNQAPNSDNEIQVIDFLKKINDAYDKDSTRFVVCLPQNQVSTRFKTFPFKERSKIAKSLPFELEDDIPMDTDDAVFSAKTICYKGKISEVLTSASPKENIENLIEKFKNAGIDPDIISIEGFALANLIENFSHPIPALPADEVNDSDDEDEKNNTHVEYELSSADILLNIGHNKTIASVYRDSSLIACRTIEWGGKDIANSIAQKYEIHYQEALKELQIKSFLLTSQEGASKDQIVFSETIAKDVNYLLRDLKISLLEIKTELNLLYSNIYLTGGTSRIKNLPKYISQQLGTPCSLLSYVEKFPIRHIDNSPKLEALAGTSLGLALEGCRKANNPSTNLRKNDFAKKSERFKKTWDQWGYTAKLASIALVGFFIYAFSKDYFATDIADKAYKTLRKQAKIVGLKGSSAKPKGIKLFIRKKNSEIKNKEILSTLFDMNSSLDLLEKISQSIPGKNFVNLNISNFIVKNDKVTIKGTARNGKHLRLLENSLKQFAYQGEFSKLSVPSATRTNLKFHYNFKVDRGIANK